MNKRSSGRWALGLVDDNKHQEDDHCQKTVDDVYHLLLSIVAKRASLWKWSWARWVTCFVQFTSSCRATLAKVATSLVSKAMQSLSCPCFTVPGGLKLLPQLLEGLLCPFWPRGIHPVREGTLIGVLLNQAMQCVSMSQETVIWEIALLMGSYYLHWAAQKPPTGVLPPTTVFITAWRPCSHLLILTTCKPLQSFSYLASGTDISL